MTTELTKQNDEAVIRGWIFYDAECAACVLSRNRAGRLFESYGFRWVPLQTPGAAARLGVSDGDLAMRMHLLTAEGKVRHNADAFGVLCRAVWWLWPLGVLLLVPGFREVGQVAYDWLARNRYCFGGRCKLPTKRQPDRWLPLVLLPTLAILLGSKLEPWVFMWLLAFAIYAGCKWLTYRDALTEGVSAPARTRLIYLLLWPGMSLKEFAGPPPIADRTAASMHLLAAISKTLFGAWLVWFGVHGVADEAWLLRGWVGMIGLIMMLHFGTFHVLALALQAAGFNARPNMRAPLLASSLADFWGRRWNTAFNVLADRYGFRPLKPLIGPRTALATVFLASGLIHELVLTLPAGGGYGLPTLYFALQAAGLFIERLALVRRRPLLNRVFAWLVLLAPLGWLFPPVFVRNVILPMLQAFGAT